MAAKTAYIHSVSRPDGRSGKSRKGAGEESPGSMDERCRITSGEGNLRDSATEIIPPAEARKGGRRVRVKRCGKSAPRFRQRERHGKPHREQDRIGAARKRETVSSQLSDEPPGLVA